MISIYDKSIPFFSIIICSFNRATLIERALSSIIKQTENDWEAIIVDDGSSDFTTNIIKPYCDKYENIRYMYHRNKGLALSRNVGALAANGLYITFLDSDDEYKENHLELRKALLINCPDLDLLHGGIEIIGEEFVPDYKNPKSMIHINDCTVGGTFFIKKSSFLETDGFRDIGYAEDSEFYNRFKCLGHTIAKTTYPTYIYHRELDDSITKQKAQESH